MNPVAIRLLNQQLVAPQFSDPADVVGHLGAIQAQEYRLMRWGVAMRTKKPSAKAFKKAFDDGRIIRLHLMRGTWQLVAAEDYWSMLNLCAAKAIAVTKGWMSSNKISIPNDELMHIREILVQTAADKGSVTKEDFVQALADKNHIQYWINKIETKEAAHEMRHTREDYQRRSAHQRKDEVTRTSSFTTASAIGVI